MNDINNWIIIIFIQYNDTMERHLRASLMLFAVLRK